MADTDLNSQDYLTDSNSPNFPSFAPQSLNYRSEPQPDTSNENIGGKYLNLVLSALGAGGAGKALATVLSPAAFRRMAPEGARSMHPALGAWTGIKNLTSPEALKKQRAADDLIMSKMPAIQSSLEDPNIDWNKIFFQSGWTKSPVTGFGREIPDTGLSIISGRLHHPEGNIMGALNIDPRIKWQSPKQLGSPTFLGGFRSNVSPAELHLSKSLRNTPGYLHDTLAERAQIYPDYNFPWENLLRGTAAHELQHGAQHFEGNLRPTYNWRVPWAERPHEREARATELRALNPESYVSPFQGTLSNLNYGDFKEHILDKIKGR